MKLGRMVSPGRSVDELTQDARRLGLEALEFALPMQLGPMGEADWRNIVDAGRRFDGPIALHEVIVLAYANRDASVRTRIEERIEEDLRLAAESGAGVLVVHTTCTRSATSLEAIWQKADTAWLARSLDRDVTDNFDESVDAFVELLGRICPKAEECGVTIAVENNFREAEKFGRRLDGISDLLMILDRVRSPALGICFDIYKSHTTEPSIGEAIRRCGDGIVDVHATDIRHTDTGFFRRRYALGDGLIDWDDALGALLSVGYDGAVVLEMLVEDRDIKTSRERFLSIRGDLAGGGR